LEERRELDSENGDGGTDVAAGRRARIHVDQRLRIGEDSGGIDGERRHNESSCRKIDFGDPNFRAREFGMWIWTGGIVMRRLRVAMTTVGWRMRTASMAEAVAVALGVPEESSHGNQHECANPSRLHP
jgi:hypothetical protein